MTEIKVGSIVKRKRGNTILYYEVTSSRLALTTGVKRWRCKLLSGDAETLGSATYSETGLKLVSP